MGAGALGRALWGCNGLSGASPLPQAPRKPRQRRWVQAAGSQSSTVLCACAYPHPRWARVVAGCQGAGPYKYLCWLPGSSVVPHCLWVHRWCCRSLQAGLYPTFLKADASSSSHPWGDGGAGAGGSPILHAALAVVSATCGAALCHAARWPLCRVSSCLRHRGFRFEDPLPPPVMLLSGGPARAPPWPWGLCCGGGWCLPEGLRLHVPVPQPSPAPRLPAPCPRPSPCSASCAGPGGGCQRPSPDGKGGQPQPACASQHRL